MWSILDPSVFLFIGAEFVGADSQLAVDLTDVSLVFGAGSFRSNDLQSYGLLSTSYSISPSAKSSTFLTYPSIIRKRTQEIGLEIVASQEKFPRRQAM
ncbi:MAG: hypothetical protein MMC33_003714 [Icmadophila ericetorum]|nr:hypothetical protein [Icmadophila ericetorum]